MRSLRLVSAALALAALAAAEPEPHKTDWMHRGKWGVMLHYTSAWQNLEDPKEWNEAIEQFDAKGLAKQLSDAGAGWLLITAKHGGQNPLAPNSVYEAKHPGRCPKRDLIADLADELSKRNVRLMLYYATAMGVDPVPETGNFSAKVIEEWSKRYGTKVSGWWLDNNVGNRDLQKALAAACRAGNEKTLVAFSPPHNPRRNSPEDDYTAGNTHAPGMAPCRGRFVDGAQWHLLSYVGHNWAGYSKKSGGRWPPAKVADFTKGIVGHGGVVTWDVKPSRSGLIAEEHLPYLQAAGKAAGTTPTLTLERDGRWLIVRGSRLPGGEIKIHYLEAYCRANSTDADWGKHTVVPHVSKVVSLSDDKRTLKIRDVIADGVTVDHVIVAKDDEVDFRLTAHNPGERRSEVHWAQPCVQLGRFTGFDPKGKDLNDYLPKCFVFLDGKLERMPTRDWATTARYVPGQVWCPPHVPRTDVNPRPLSKLVPSNGLIGAYSGDESLVFATAWEPYQELFQGVIRCLHSDLRLGGLQPGETKTIRGKIYIVPPDVPALLKRYTKDFPEHAR